MTDPLLRWRDEFPILAVKNYLISNSLGAMPKRVADRMQDYARMWSTRGVEAWGDEWWEMPLRTADALAPVIGAGPGELSMHPNITTITGIVLSCFDDPTLRKGRTRVVSEALHFPSVLYATRGWCETRDMELALVPSDDGMTIDTQRMVDAIDERTLLVSVCHVLFKSAYIQDVRAIVEKAHRVGALVLMDGYQSAGILPVNVKALGADMFMGGVLKWLCGGPGGAFLYVHPDLQRRVQPRFTGWMAHREPFAFSPEQAYADSPARFLLGTPAIPALYAAAEGTRIILEAGVDAIRAKSVRQTSLLIDLADRSGFAVRSPRKAELRGGTVTLDIPEGHAVAQELISRGVVVDYRVGAGIRISPHFYNSDAEVRESVEAMKDIVATGAYRRHVGRARTVT